MNDRSDAQKIGARGHRQVAVLIEEHPHWLSRDLGEDFGIDLEAELTEQGVRGEILKIQIKSAESVDRNDVGVRAIIERKYISYAESCRYPVIFVVVDITTKEAWYVWLQDWLLKRRELHGELDRSQGSWTHWIPYEFTLAKGLDRELKAVARWEGEAQLTLSLMDALRSAAAIYHTDAMAAISNMIDMAAPKVADASVDIIIREALRLGDRLRATIEGNAVAQQLYQMVRKYGSKLSLATISSIVLREDGLWSRVGLGALGILYDEHREHMCSLHLSSVYAGTHPHVAYYCAFREDRPDTHSANVMTNPKDFAFAGLKYIQPEMYWDKYANRGPSALLEYLAPIDYVEEGDGA
ncbi:DUF4365 domain-containing protein [Sorangium sp. So ce406]|uniref:DUF4365 domain-containing protein n=1 Tax=Sorangium sp. So ce406 TaxID=3133311 RepID=UPI003F5BB83A